METLTNISSAASRAIWGDPAKDTEGGNETAGQEPVSGETGDVAAGEPYDKGNEGMLEPTSTRADNTPADPTASSPNTNDISSSTTNTADAPGNTPPLTGPIHPEHGTDKTGVTSIHNPTSATSSDKLTSSNDTSSSGANPSVSADPSSAPQQTQKHQGVDLPNEEPGTGTEEHARIAETKKEADEAAKIDTSGPGPRPLSEIRGSAATNGAAGAADGEDGPQKESHGEGTGKKYIKSSGMKADGGDFDASNPGAGREADRLLESKGISHEIPGKQSAVEPTSSKGSDTKDSGETKEKLSLKDKIKAKLHKS